MPRSNETATPRDPNRLTESVRLRRLLAPALLSASLLGATAGSAQTPRAERYVAPNAKSAQTPDSTYTDQAPKFDDVLSDIQTQLAEQAGPLPPNGFLSRVSREDALGQFMNFELQREKLLRMTIKKAGSSSLVASGVRYDTLLRASYASVVSREWIASANSNGGFWYETPLDPILPNYIVSPDIAYQTKTDMRPYVKIGKKRLAIGPSVALNDEVDYSYQKESLNESGDYVTSAGTYSRLDGGTTVLKSENPYSQQLRVTRQPSADEFRKGIFIRVRYTWKPRVRSKILKAGNLTRWVGPFKGAKGTKALQ